MLILKQDLAGRIFASALFLVHIVVDGLNVQKSLLKAGVIILHASQHSDTVTPCQLFTGHFEPGRNVKNGKVRSATAARWTSESSLGESCFCTL